MGGDGLTLFYYLCLWVDVFVCGGDLIKLRNHELEKLPSKVLIDH